MVDSTNKVPVAKETVDAKNLMSPELASQLQNPEKLKEMLNGMVIGQIQSAMAPLQQMADMFGIENFNVQEISQNLLGSLGPGGSFMAATQGFAEQKAAAEGAVPGAPGN